MAGIIIIAVLTGVIITGCTAIINKQYISPAKQAGLICLTGIHKIYSPVAFLGTVSF
jgi:hypothetical protein